MVELSNLRPPGKKMKSNLSPSPSLVSATILFTEATSEALLVPVIQEDIENKNLVITQLLTTVPDSIINFNHRKTMPASKEFLGVTLFADISGFTALTEKYSTMETSGGTRGTDKLCATLNTYIGMIVDEIVMRKGDVLKFAGDAILAIWRFSDIGHNAKATLNKVIKCSFDIQRKCDNYMTEVGIVLRVKLAVAVGSMCLTIVGLPNAKQFDLSGSAIVDVGVSEKEATPGSIILSQLAWANCDQNLFSVESLHKGRFFKVIGYAHSETKIEKERNEENVAQSLQSSQRLVTSNIDHLIDKVVDYRQDMPKALLPDDDEKISAGVYLTQKMLSDKKKSKQLKKFDRLTMTCNLNDDEIKQLRAYVPGQVLYKLDHGQNLEWLSEMRQVSVLFINMKLPDFALEASEALQKSFEVVYGACIEYKGTLNKVFSFDKGCTFIVIFGLPGQKHENDPIRALECAHSTFESLHALQEISNESIGVTTGVAFCGVVGHKDRHEYTVIGSKVNMAARLMMFYPGMLTCDADTYEFARMRLREEDFIAMPYIELKGLKDPGTVREYDPHSSKKDDEEDFDYPILGRRKEIDCFKLMLNEYKANMKKKIIVIAGNQGIGKTRLLEEFMDEATKHNCKVIHLPVDIGNGQSECDVGSNMVRLLLGNSDEERQAAILPLAHNDTDIMENIALIGDIVGKKKHQPQKTSDLGEVGRWRNKILIKIICMILNQEQRYFFAIDNAMNIDEKSWKFISRLIKDANIMITFVIRSWDSTLSSYAKTILQNDSHQLLLGGLDKVTMIDFVCQLLQVNKIPKKLCSIIETKGQGIPSWCEQLIKNMLYSKVIQVVPQEHLVVIDSKSSNEDEKLVPKKELPRGNDLNTESLDDNLNLSSSQYVFRVTEKVKENVSKTHISPTNSSYGVYIEKDYVQATPGAVAGEKNNVCIISPNADVNSMLVPDSVEDMVLARMDRMTLIEQTVIKCAAVLGLSFTRDLLKAIIPKNCINMLDTTLQNLLKLQFFECGSLATQSPSTYDMHQNTAGGGMGKTHHHNTQGIHNVQLLCGCYACEGYPVINLLQANAFADGKKRICLFFHFCNSFVQETAYALWLEDQRRALFEKAALYLEVYADKCRACGGNGFVPGHGVGKSISKQLDNTTSRRYSVCQKTRFASTQGRDNNMRLQDLKTILPDIGKTEKIPETSGDIIGMALAEMANIYATTKSGNKNTASKGNVNFLKKANVNPSLTAKMSLQTNLKNFCNSLVISSRRVLSRERASTLYCQEIDLSQCQCLELQAMIIPKLVYYWKSSGNKIKTFQYSLDAALVALDTNDSLKALNALKSIDELVKTEEEKHFSDFIITDEERARIESLKGQALCQIDCFDKGVHHFISALEYLKYPPPVSWLGVNLRTCKASLVQLLHQKMPGVFIDTKREYNSNIIDQINILSHLAKAYKARKEYDRAYWANLEQLNAAEEIANDYWHEVMVAYTDMISSCQIYGKESLGHILDKTALQTAESATITLEDMQDVGSLHMSLLSFHLSAGNLSKAFDSGTTAYKIGNSVKDPKLLTSCIPVLAQVSIMKMMFQSSDSMISQLRTLTEKLEGRLEKWIYHCCCIDMMLHAGEYTDMVSKMTMKLKRNSGGYTGFAMNYVSNGLALWYARQQSTGNASTYYMELKDEPERVDPLLYCNAIAISTEYLLHRFRLHPTVHLKQQVHEALKLFQQQLHGKSLLQARRYHFQAYFAYLRRKPNRAKILLEDCLIESKNNDLTFDYEWALASKNTWFAEPDVDIESQITGSIKYILPRII